MHQAITNSARTLAVGGYSVGYLRLWTGTGRGGLERYHSNIASMAQTDALILDLRGGFGGAWYEHLDPFFPDRKGYFSFEVIDRNGVTEYHPEPQENRFWYGRPMVVLINEGTRSGKEAVAYQFKASGRAVLIGTRTSGALSAGKGLLLEDGMRLIYYLAVAEYRLNGHRIEGRGISPNIRVPYPVISSDRTSRLSDGDPQVIAALEYLRNLLDQSTH
jgi:carboxyl-terminal processing protease